MRNRALPIIVLVVGFLALLGSGAWALSQHKTHDGGWMTQNASNWMMGDASGATTPVRSVTAARVRAQRFADRHDLKVAEVIQFTNNYYARLDDKSGKPATEILIDPMSGNASLEYGPAMMWNTRYGMLNDRSRSGMLRGSMGSDGMGSMSGGMNDAQMMGSTDGGMWTPASSSAIGPKSAQQAVAFVDSWLAKRDSSLSVPDADAFPGYYTMETKRNGEIVGMVSISASSGAIWNHWWHGDFVAISH